MLLLVGQVAREAVGREGFQEVDYAAVLRPDGEVGAQIDDAARVPELIARAFAVATSGRPGPVVLALPEDMLTDVVDVPDARAAPAARRHAARRRGDGAPDGAARGRGAPAGDRRRGRLDARTGELDVAAFGEAQRIPVAASFRCQDYVDNRSPAYAGHAALGMDAALARRIRDADVLLAIGGRLERDHDRRLHARRAAGARAAARPRPSRPGRARDRLRSRSSAIACGLEAFAEAAAALLARDGRAGSGCSRRPTPSTSATCTRSPSSPARCRCPPSWRRCANGSARTRSSRSGAGQLLDLGAPLLRVPPPRDPARAAQRLDGLRRPGRRRGEGRAPGASRGLHRRGRRLPHDRAGARDRGAGGPADRRARGEQRHVRHDPHAPGAPLPGARRRRPTCATRTSRPTRGRSARTARSWSAPRTSGPRARRGAALRAPGAASSCASIRRRSRRAGRWTRSGGGDVNATEIAAGAVSPVEAVEDALDAHRGAARAARGHHGLRRRGAGARTQRRAAAGSPACRCSSRTSSTPPGSARRTGRRCTPSTCRSAPRRRSPRWRRRARSSSARPTADEFAWGTCGQNTFYGDPVNPTAPDRIAGGSSSGNAVALAAGHGAARRSGPTPAGPCGCRPARAAIVGLKTALGAVSDRAASSRSSRASTRSGRWRGPSPTARWRTPCSPARRSPSRGCAGCASGCSRRCPISRRSPRPAGARRPRPRATRSACAALGADVREAVAARAGGRHVAGVQRRGRAVARGDVPQPPRRVRPDDPREARRRAAVTDAEYEAALAALHAWRQHAAREPARRPARVPHARRRASCRRRASTSSRSGWRSPPTRARSATSAGPRSPSAASRSPVATPRRSSRRPRARDIRLTGKANSPPLGVVSRRLRSWRTPSRRSIAGRSRTTPPSTCASSSASGALQPGDKLPPERAAGHPPRGLAPDAARGRPRTRDHGHARDAPWRRHVRRAPGRPSATVHGDDRPAGRADRGALRDPTSPGAIGHRACSGSHHRRRAGRASTTWSSAWSTRSSETHRRSPRRRRVPPRSSTSPRAAR